MSECYEVAPNVKIEGRVKEEARCELFRVQDYGAGPVIVPVGAVEAEDCPQQLGLTITTEREVDGRWIADIENFGIAVYGATEREAIMKALDLLHQSGQRDLG